MKDICQKIKDFFFFLIRPSFWVMNNPYDSYWDKILNSLIKNHEFTDRDEYFAKIDVFELWIANHPYSSFTPYHPFCLSVRPKRRTIYNAMVKLNKTGRKFKSKEQEFHEFAENYLTSRKAQLN